MTDEIFIARSPTGFVEIGSVRADPSPEQIERVARAVWDADGPLNFPREEAHLYWPGSEARRFLAMLNAALEGCK